MFRVKNDGEYQQQNNEYFGKDLEWDIESHYFKMPAV